MGSDLLLRASRPRHIDGDGRRLRALDPLGVVVRDLRHRLGEGDGLLHAARRKSRRTDAHRRTIAEAVVGRRVIGDEHPPVEAPAIAAVRIVPPDAPHPVHRIRAQARIKRLLRLCCIREPRGIRRRCVRCLPLRLHDRLRHGQRHNAVIRRKTALRKKLKVLAAVIVELKPRTDNIANDCPQHRMASFKENHTGYFSFPFLTGAISLCHLLCAMLGRKAQPPAEKAFSTALLPYAQSRHNHHTASAVCTSLYSIALSSYSVRILLHCF